MKFLKENLRVLAASFEFLVIFVFWKFAKHISELLSAQIQSYEVHFPKKGFVINFRDFLIQKK